MNIFHNIKVPLLFFVKCMTITLSFLLTLQCNAQNFTIISSLIALIVVDVTIA